jgi:hypothetical protein
MGKTIVNGAHAHSNVEVVLIFESGVRHQVLTCSTINYSNEASHVGVAGTQMGPVTLADGAAEPTWDMELTKTEMTEILGKMGPGYLRQSFEISVGFRAIGKLERQVDTVIGAKMETEGIASSSGETVMASPKGKCLVAKINGIDPFNDGDVQ